MSAQQDDYLRTDNVKEIIYVTPYEIDEFSYWSARHYSTEQWIHAINAGLLKRKSVLYNKYGLNLAESMPTANADATVFTIKLKQNLTFNTGNPLTADDVVFSYQVVLNPDINRNSYRRASQWFASNDSIVALDDHTIQFTLTDSYGFANGLFSYPIIDQEYYQSDYDACIGGENACDWNSLKFAKVSAGPFQYEELDETNQVMTLVKNPNYWNAENVLADAISFKFILDKAEAIAELQAGTADILDARYKPLADELSGITGIVDRMVPDAAHGEMSVNHLNPFFGTGEMVPDTGEITDDAEQARLLRKAISHNIDRDFLGTFFGNLSMAASNVMPAACTGWRSLPLDEYNIEQAKGIMEKIGFDYSTLTDANSDGLYEDSFFEVVVIGADKSYYSPYWAKAVSDALPRLGIGAELKVIPWSEIIPRTFGYANGTLVPGYAEGGFDILFVNYSWDLDWDPTGLFDESGLADRGTGDNYYNFINETVSAKVLQYTSEYDTEKRIQLVGELQEMLHHNRPVLPLVYHLSHWAWDSDLVGIDKQLLNHGIQEWENVVDLDWYVVTDPSGKTTPPPTTSETESSSTSEDTVPLSSLWLVPILLGTVLKRKQRKINPSIRSNHRSL